MLKIILTVGISNSGKTTWAEQYKKELPNVININRDDIRALQFNGNIKNYKFSKDNEKLVNDYQDEMVKYAAYYGYNIIVSDTNLNPKVRNKWKQLAKEINYIYEEKVFHIEPHIAKKRNIKRDYSIPPHVIDEQYKKFREYLNIEPYVYDENNKSTYVIFDIDGTIASMDGVRKPYEWKKCINDKPRKSVIDLLNLFNNNGDSIILVSGRDSVCRKETEQWLEKYKIPYEHLFMRMENDIRSDSEIKEEIFNNEIRNKFNVRLVVDDRQQMVDRWRVMGLECWQVNSGDF